MVLAGFWLAWRPLQELVARQSTLEPADRAADRIQAQPRERREEALRITYTGYGMNAVGTYDIGVLLRDWGATDHDDDLIAKTGAARVAAEAREGATAALGEMLVWQARMLENFDFLYDKPFLAAAKRADSLN